jgi:hypothetical protein
MTFNEKGQDSFRISVRVRVRYFSRDIYGAGLTFDEMSPNVRGRCFYRHGKQSKRHMQKKVAHISATVQGHLIFVLWPDRS